ncbi:MAG: 50S ribosomal protein L17 [Anaerolineae bacterium]|nr:50S ribosomal protein L17 [Anaerolineae bacterium]
MRHRVAGKRLGRDTDHRKSLRRNLITQLFMHEKIKTTRAKAEAIRAQAEKMITLARNRGDAEALVELAEDRNEVALNRRLTTAQARTLLAHAGNPDELEKYAHAIAAHAQRLIARDIHNREIVYKLFHEIAPRYATRPGGYTRVIRMGQRVGDAAEMVMLALLESQD